jgi:capsular exopolysaccharide synthesis family protein
MSATTTWAGDGTGDGPGLKKTTADYIKALRRRLWLVLMIAVLVGGGGVMFTLFVQDPVFLANAVIRIEPPRSAMRGIDDGVDAREAAGYFATRVELISARRVGEEVIRDLRLAEWPELYGVKDPVAELMGWIKVKPRKNSNLVDVSLEGKDPKIVAKIVNATANTFKRLEQQGIEQSAADRKRALSPEITNAQAKLEQAKRELNEFKRSNPSFLSGSISTEQEELVQMNQARAGMEIEYGRLRHTESSLKAAIESGAAPIAAESQRAHAAMKEELEAIQDALSRYKEKLQPKYFNANPEIRKLVERKEKLEKDVTEIGKGDAEAELARVAQLTKQQESLIQGQLRAIAELKGKIAAQLDKRQKHDELIAGVAARSEDHARVVAEGARAELSAPLMLPSIDIEEAIEPKQPVRPIFWLQIPLCIIGAFLLGAGLVVCLEMADGTIREPEQAAASLDWPLLGVVPRLNRRELQTVRGKFLLASELPGSGYCEGFRNLRMGILGTENGRRMRSLLVASSKRGEGKTMVAANLAAACARAGETVCLVDMDLREPSLGDYFELPPENLGLTEILEGSVPWPRALVETELPNLMVMPAGNSDGVPMDILGTAEMHDLVAELAEKFDRVIIDGPALLGLADSRAVGRFVDGVVFVARAGSLDQKPLLRVKQIFAQEGLKPIGIVFNGMKERHDDIAAGVKSRKRRPATAARSVRPEATVAAGTQVAEGATPASDAA